ncbi:cytochrome P450 [Saccharopolyspora subtropica]|uniref:Cytochrome P450 n=1 Tax=Saccharopolyspora thermophila TaxID=89367 RepID=A0A917N660_9PSEU|nr:cytochrome P450 [Saccharopolyspora subtropica]GGI69497.1 cytochrome P450 [Saccharopolyspora subtropica]
MTQQAQEQIRSEHDVPGPRGLRPGMLRDLQADTPNFLAGLRDRYGPIVRVPLGPTTIYLVSDPVAINDVLISSAPHFDSDIIGKGSNREAPLTRLLGRGLLTSTGEHHKKQRKLLQPLFHRQRVAGYADTFAELAAQRSATWSDGQRLDVLVEMVELTLAVVTRTIFDVDLDSDVTRTVRTALPKNDGPLRWAMSPGGSLLVRLPLPSNLRFQRGRRALDAVVHRMVQERRRTGVVGEDLLSMLIAARDADTGEPMSDQQIRDEVLTLLMAGHDTTANGLAWTFHLLGSNPRAAELLAAEVDEVLGDRLPTFADLPRLAWTKAVFSEALRIYPPVWTVARRALTEYTVLGYRLPVDATVMMSSWVVHRDPRWWPDPERFAPQRWVPSAPDGSTDNLTGTALDRDRPRFSYFPFGGGPRQCIGNEFALLEAVMALATIAQRWRFEPVPGHRVAPRAKIIVRPRGGLPMTVRARS